MAGQVRKYVAHDVAPPQGRLELDVVGVAGGTGVVTGGTSVATYGSTVVTGAAGPEEEEEVAAAWGHGGGV